MIEVWDYFMRRKSLLLMILSVFLASSILSYNIFRTNATTKPVEYISIRHWGNNDIEVPRTGGESPVLAIVLRPREVTNLSPRQDGEALVAETNPEPEVADPLENPESTESDITYDPTTNDDIDTSDNPDLDTPENQAPADVLPPEDIVNNEAGNEAETLPSDTSNLDNAQKSDIPKVETGKDVDSGYDWGYLVFLVVIGLIVAGFGTYFFEQHFWR